MMSKRDGKPWRQAESFICGLGKKAGVAPGLKECLQ